MTIVTNGGAVSIREIPKAQFGGIARTLEGCIRRAMWTPEYRQELERREEVSREKTR